MFGKIVVLALLLTLAWGVLARSSSGAGREQIYVVRATDTLWSIAAAHYAGDPRDAIWRLERRNRLVTDTLRPGERLILP